MPHRKEFVCRTEEFVLLLICGRKIQGKAVRDSLERGQSEPNRKRLSFNSGK